MKRFWKWMQEKGYAIRDGLKKLVYCDMKRLDSRYMPKQMLVGYMLEYIRDHKWWDNKPNCVAEIIKCDMARDVGMVWNCKDQFVECKRIISIMDGKV